jgi:hypothetical protein
MELPTAVKFPNAVEFPMPWNFRMPWSSQFRGVPNPLEFPNAVEFLNAVEFPIPWKSGPSGPRRSELTTGFSPSDMDNCIA